MSLVMLCPAKKREGVVAHPFRVFVSFATFFSTVWAVAGLADTPRRKRLEQIKREEGLEKFITGILWGQKSLRKLV